MFSGSTVAIITPFRDGKVDLTSFQSLIEWHIQEGTKAIVACGSTGEGALLTREERHYILSTAIDTSAGRIPIIAGCGSPSTHEAISMVKEAASLGAVAALIVTPYYVKPTQEGIYQHFAAISKAGHLPLIAYNNPGRSVVDMSVSLIERLAKLPNVVGLKDSSVDLTRPIQLRERIQKDFWLLSGDDPTVAAYLAHGGQGWISVTANTAPKLCQELVTAWHSQDLIKFAELRDRLLPLHQALGVENPCSSKYALSLLGHCRNELRLPLIPVTPATEQLVAQAMQGVGIIVP